MKEIIKWIDINDLNSIYTSEYWNDIEAEKKKEWWVTDVEKEKITGYLYKSGLLEEFNIAVGKVEEKKALKGNILDVAAGVCWTSAMLSKKESVTNIDALDFSYHRLNDIAPNVFKVLGARDEKTNRIFGTFYDIKKDAGTYDLIFMSQAFHHAEAPLKLLFECDRVLKPGGLIVLIGEHQVGVAAYWKRVLKSFLTTGKLNFNFYELFKPDDILGDHYYRMQDYYFMFGSLGYIVQHHATNISNSVIIIATKR